MRTWRFRCLIALVLVSVAVAHDVRAQETGTAEPAAAGTPATPQAPEPFRLETPVQIAPRLTLGVSDPERLVEQLRELWLKQKGHADAPVELQRKAEIESPAAPQRLFRVDPGAIVNDGPFFGFVDVTPRDGSPYSVPSLTPEQRRANAESYRRSLSKKSTVAAPGDAP